VPSNGKVFNPCLLALPNAISNLLRFSLLGLFELLSNVDVVVYVVVLPVVW